MTRQKNKESEYFSDSDYSYECLDINSQLEITEKSLDFFTRINRETPVSVYIPLFIDMFNEDNEMSMKVLMNLRDINNGKGEKQISQMILFLLKITKPEIYKLIIKDIVIKFGCWKDLLVICELTKKYNKDISNSFEMNLFAEQLEKDRTLLEMDQGACISLAGKWAPSENTHFDKYPLKLAKGIREKLNMTPKQYRKTLTCFREQLNIIEMYMSTEQYSKIDFSKIPYVAYKQYKKAFERFENSKKEYNENREILSDRYDDYIPDIDQVDINCPVSKLDFVITMNNYNPPSFPQTTIQFEFIKRLKKILK